MAMIGTSAWLARTSGDLSGLDKLRLLTTIIGLRLKARLRPDISGQCNIGSFDLALPDSRLVNMALEECRESCSPPVFHHSCRTYLWAVALAQLGSVKYDPEELVVAALLHDVELGKVATRQETGCKCFAGAGAVAAHDWLILRGVEEEARDQIVQAIAMHLNPGVPLSIGPTPHLLNVGAMADVVGTRIAAIPDEQRKHILAAHPRTEFKLEMTRLMKIEQNHNPQTRAGFLMGIGFATLIAKAAFEE
jgi:hypothetical protein